MTNIYSNVYVHVAVVAAVFGLDKYMHHTNHISGELLYKIRPNSYDGMWYIQMSVIQI